MVLNNEMSLKEKSSASDSCPSDAEVNLPKKDSNRALLSPTIQEHDMSENESNKITKTALKNLEPVGVINIQSKESLVSEGSIEVSLAEENANVSAMMGSKVKREMIPKVSEIE